MSWFKVDDRLWGHPKWLATTPRARALWVTAGSWCAAMGTDGFVPAHVVPALSGRRDDAMALVSVGLWVEGHGGFTFHDWADFQPDTASQKAKREAESQGGDLGNHRRWHEKRRIKVPGCVHCEASGTRSGTDRGAESPPNPPDPTRPDPTVPPTEVQGGAGGGSSAPSDAPADAGATATPKTKRGTRIPEPFPVTSDMVTWARRECPGLDHRAVTEKFIDHWRAQPGQRGVKLDWVATWRNWMRREHEQRAGRSSTGATSTRGRGFWDREVTLP